MSARQRPNSSSNGSAELAPAPPDGPAAATVAATAREPGAPNALTPRQLVRAALVFCYLAWFVLLATGVGAYEGE